MANANAQFYTANGFYLKPEDIFKISFYNDIVDKNSRNVLDKVDPNDYPVFHYGYEGINLCHYVIPENFKDFIK